MRPKVIIAAAIGGLLIAPAVAGAFCGFYVSGADAKLFNNATQVVMMRNGTRTVLSMQNNYQGPPENFAMVVPVPVVLQKDNVKTLPREIFDRVDTLAAPRWYRYTPASTNRVMVWVPPDPKAVSHGHLPLRERVRAVFGDRLAVFFVGTGTAANTLAMAALTEPWQQIPLPALLAVIGIYLAFISISHEFTSSYYSLLATSFRNGELALPLKPDPALLKLPNPYDPAARQGLKVPVDLSLYNGKFYLYWGPAPSLLVAIFQSFLSIKVSEAELLFSFMCGIFLSQFLLIMNLREHFFPETPKWLVLLSIFFAGLANPALWLLSQPKIYEAAIAGAQFFFIAGFTSAVQSLGRQPFSRWGLAVAGVCWALAVGTRSVMAFPVGFMTFMVLYLLFKTYRLSFFRFVAEVIPLGLPLFIGALGFCWYNWARFGSFFETGFTYQLAAPYLQKHINELFLPSYIFQNLYNYLLNPFTIEQSFPFLYPIRGRIEAILPWPSLPELYTAQAITGLLCTTPFLVFASLPAARYVKELFRKYRAQNFSENPNTVSFHWITISLLGSFALPCISLLGFFWAAMRYVEDFMPSLTLLSIVGFWQGYQAFSQDSNKGKMYTAVGLILAGLSIVIGVLLALSIFSTRGTF